MLEAADGQITSYPCGYAEYAEQKKRAAQEQAAARNAQKTAGAADRSRAERAEEAKRKQRAKEVERAIAAREEEEAALNTALADPAACADYKKVNEACARLDRLRAELDALYAEYETLI